MAEEKNKKKKAGIVWRILKWFGLALLVLLLIASIILQAPWKVITLLAIVLLACTALPKPARKWFWLSVGAIVIALIIWVFLPDDTEGWRPYTFDEELATLEAKRAIPDSENAAIIYNKLLDNFNEEAFEPNFLDDKTYYLIRTEPWSSKDYPEIAQWLKGHQSTITKLLEASKIEKCRFPISDPTNIEQQIDYGALRHWARLLIRAAYNDLGDGRVDQALEKQIAVLQMAKHLYQQPTMIDLLIGMAIEALAFEQFDRFVIVDDATEEHLSVIENALAGIKHDWSSDLPKILEFEKLLFKNTLGTFYEVNPEGRTRLNRGSGLSFCGRLKCELPKRKAKRNYWRGKLTKAGTILGWLYMPSTLQKASEIIDAGYERLYTMAEPDFDWEKAMEKPSRMLQLNYRYLVEHLTGILEPIYHRIHEQYLRVIALQRGNQLLIGLRRYKNKNGYWPESLDDIKSLAPEEIFVDPTNGNSFVYKLTEENFTLYSKGKNNIDENGEYQDGADDWLIWTRKSRKTQEKKANAEQQ